MNIILTITDKQEIFLRNIYGQDAILPVILQQQLDELITERVKKAYTPRLTTDKMIDEIIK